METNTFLNCIEKTDIFNANCHQMKLKEGDIVRFIPEYEDGKQEFDYILIEDPDGDRVKVMPINSKMELPPIQVVKLEWLKKIE